LGLAPEQLCQALGKVETRIAMLALCGLPNQVTESVLAVLPRAHAKKVRVKMNSLDSLHLREIDEAKERVAHASLDTSSQTLSQVPVAA
jgi:flagellar motor switch protein FliG